ncbi:MAG: hypothetical protein OSB17_00455 [Ulvibacter sp.]|jgi:hypothetical protein|nr:hypothetical protein [Ulvibacter sp.]CAI8395969.1 MAG: Uncharacterised protein [Flavobacteriaceae bacterium]|tara:strand:- start:231 stop:383 length:153 start_codon:yes stop_codon:yes gene_type:complete
MKEKSKIVVFDPKKVTPEGSLAILALGDIGFDAWRKVKIAHNKFRSDEEK